MEILNKMSEPPAQFVCPVLEDLLSASELHELFSPFWSGKNRPVYSVEERKIRRKASNRESARRSRLRKKMLLESLDVEVNRLRTENRRLKNRLCEATLHCQALQTETDRLLAEFLLLEQRLGGLMQVLINSMQLEL
ncbi:hypothetical protein DM860_006657 [Cuscuta australis]|uniref:BZIP domain-containing protein n=1 Tax=Cuscuta australis TaxID=267555 RepID=A0A328D465_9ASTE|nr:hypothetical protein DM860_006657 [Cuscuta australis]